MVSTLDIYTLLGVLVDNAHGYFMSCVVFLFYGPEHLIRGCLRGGRKILEGRSS